MIMPTEHQREPLLENVLKMSKVGFIGLGTMGRHMARNLLKAGHELFFMARREEVAREFR